MTPEQEKYIQQNRLKQSMIDMHLHLNVPLKHVRNYMVENNLMLSQAQIQELRAIKRRKNKFVPIAEKGAWNHNALP